MMSIEDLRQQIGRSGKTIYDLIADDHPELFLSPSQLQGLLSTVLVGVSLHGLALRTRSKVVKSLVAEALGYAVPKSFAKTQPRFPGQDLDVYTQKSNNLQIWNEEIAPGRRYAIIQISVDDVIRSVRVITGEELAALDSTGTLTSKYQARVDPGDSRAELLSGADTSRLRSSMLVRERPASFLQSPSAAPTPDALLPIEEVFERIAGLVGQEIDHLGATQERNRGSEVHRAVCAALGYSTYSDDGQFPDVRHQLLEVKLQTSPTIDLGLVLPTSEGALALPSLAGQAVRHCDVRYAVICGRVAGTTVKVTHVFVCTGEDFLNHFTLFGGKVLNKKLQIPLPGDFFD